MPQFVDQLDTALWVQVLIHLPPQQAARAGQTCKTLKVASREPGLWRSQTQETFGTTSTDGKDAYEDFKERWAASRASLVALRVPQLRVPVPELRRAAIRMAPQHRRLLADYFLHLLDAALGMGRLDDDHVARGVERAMVCAHDTYKARVAADGAKLEARLKSLTIKRVRQTG